MHLAADWDHKIADFRPAVRTDFDFRIGPAGSVARIGSVDPKGHTVVHIRPVLVAAAAVHTDFVGQMGHTAVPALVAGRIGSVGSAAVHTDSADQRDHTAVHTDFDFRTGPAVPVGPAGCRVLVSLRIGSVPAERKER